MGEARARHRRQDSDDDLAATALRRLASLAPVEGWVPTRPGPPVADPGGQLADPSETGDRTAVVPPSAMLRLRSARFVPAGRAVGGLVLLVALAVAVAVVSLWLARPQEQALPPRARTVGAPMDGGGPTGAGPAGPVASTDPATGAAAPGAPLLVHVVGAVRRPGVVELAPGSRVTDAVEAAGGVTRNAAPGSVNLARPVLDGEQVVVLRRGGASALAAPAPGSAPGGAGPGSSGAAAPGPAASGPVDLNSASLAQLDSLPGIGPVLAQRILDWRLANGRFTTVDELGEVSGIGEATLADLRPVVRV